MEEPAEHMYLYATSGKSEVTNESWAAFLVFMSCYIVFPLAGLNGLCKGDEWLSSFEREGKCDRPSCSLAESCTCKPKVEPDLWAWSLPQTIALAMKHQCLLVGTSSPASFRFQCYSEWGNFLSGDVWFGTSSLAGCGCYDSCSQFSKSSSHQSSANRILAYLVFSRKSKYASVFSLLIFSCLCLILFRIGDIKTALCCQYFNNRFFQKKLSPPQSMTNLVYCVAWSSEKRDWGIYFYGFPLK